MAMKWYMLQAQSNREKKAVEILNKNIDEKNARHFFEEIVVPEQETMKFVKGKKTKVKERIFKGYILIKMEMTSESQHLVQSTQYISTFVPGGGKPVPITDQEAGKILNSLENKEYVVDENHGISEGDHVKIKSGPFSSFEGKVESVNRGKIKVIVSIFDRPTPVDMSVNDVELIV